MKECLCIYTHYRSYNNIKYRFIKNKVYRFEIIDYSDVIRRYIVLTENYDEKFGFSEENFNNLYFYIKEQFEKYYTTDLKEIRKRKVENINKKSSSI